MRTAVQTNVRFARRAPKITSAFFRLGIGLYRRSKGGDRSPLWCARNAPVINKGGSSMLKLAAGSPGCIVLADRLPCTILTLSESAWLTFTSRKDCCRLGPAMNSCWTSSFADDANEQKKASTPQSPTTWTSRHRNRGRLRLTVMACSTPPCNFATETECRESYKINGCNATGFSPVEAAPPSALVRNWVCRNFC